ncbi:hypothetical protein BG015_006633 [Linnemannia schmuckeri]|uniref:Uncharacterized protein n=1 Tax=Linnemannia schmuckeri TaxID=64567 RepID=A0A9P5S709_9FUNG|nr:hypothetical protein BG015_006633 [Linnemannia schmuckeri]
MQKNELVSRINIVSHKIEDLELREKLYLNLLQRPSINRSGQDVFNATLGMQTQRHALFAVREQIFEHALEHRDLIASLHVIDQGLAKSSNFLFVHKMLMRLEQLRREVDEYNAQQSAVAEGNKDHANNNRGLITKIARVFDVTEPRSNSRFGMWGRR